MVGQRNLKIYSILEKMFSKGFLMIVTLYDLFDSKSSRKK